MTCRSVTLKLVDAPEYKFLPVASDNANPVNTPLGDVGIDQLSTINVLPMSTALGGNTPLGATQKKLCVKYIKISGMVSSTYTTHV